MEGTYGDGCEGDLGGVSLPTMADLGETLESRFGHVDFRPGQRVIVEDVLEGKDVVAVMPTGAGKSLCYQLPAVELEGTTLVVSPLISLMKDQVDALNGLGICAAFVNSTQSSGEQREIFDRARSGEIELLYLAPERFRFEGAMSALKSLNISRFIVDEAHCVSQWGHDFRPDYLNLRAAIDALGSPPVAAFTATATGLVRKDIAKHLGMREPKVHVSGFLRENLHLSVVPIKKMAHKLEHLFSILKNLDGSAIVYCATRRHCEEVTLALIQRGQDAAIYHGGLEDTERNAMQDSFDRGDTRVMVATNAFGMGIDKANVRVVVHYDVPGSVEAYYQEAGRAGRDGALAHCVLLFTYADTRIHEFFIERGRDEVAADRYESWATRERRKVRAMVRYAYEANCRHGEILDYFGERMAVDSNGCGACDLCTGDTGVPGETLASLTAIAQSATRSTRGRGGRPAKVIPTRPLEEHEQVVVQKALSAVARADGRLSNTAISRLLLGSKRPDVLSDPLAQTRSYGQLSDFGHEVVRRLLVALEQARCTQGQRPRLTASGYEVMWGRQSVDLSIAPLVSKRSKRGSDKASAPAEDVDSDLLEQLRAARLEASQELEVPAYVVASNKTLEGLAALRPEANDEAWLTVHGIGPKKVEPLRDLFGQLVEEAREAKERDAEPA
jgi:ATP-dependent DNA helicase RecQ